VGTIAYSRRQVVFIGMATSFLPVLRIRIGFNADPDPDPDPGPGFDNQKLEKIYSWKKCMFFDQKLQFTYP